MIEEYSFGHIKIDGREYTEDVEVKWTGEVSDWSRPDSHIIDKDTLERAVRSGAKTLVVGTGESGMAQITEEAARYLESQGVELVSDKTAEAVKTYNILCQDSLEEEGEQRKVVGLFHLTC